MTNEKSRFISEATAPPAGRVSRGWISGTSTSEIHQIYTPHASQGTRCLHYAAERSNIEGNGLRWQIAGRVVRDEVRNTPKG